MKYDLKVQGMTCQNCARHVQEALQGVHGVTSVQVDLASASAQVRTGSKNFASERDLLDAVKSAGYQATIVSPEERDSHCHEETKVSSWPFNLVFALIIMVLLMIAEWAFQLNMHGWFGWVSFLLALLVQVTVGKHFYAGAWRQLKIGQSNMDTLVALGSTAAFAYSVFGLIYPEKVHHLYFMEAVAIVTLVSFGHFLEARAGDKAASALKELMKLAPKKARLISDAGEERLVEISGLKKGDHIKVKPGEQIPCDARVILGEGAVNESMLTGESLPAQKRPGSEVFTGTFNENAEFILEVTSTGEDTALAHIIETVRRAQSSRANIQRLGDKISSVFVPIVIFISIGTLFGWAYGKGSWESGIINAVGVLIVACPCAMGLATPAAIMAGTNAAAKRGILIRDGIALEKCGTITGIVFDKTGTLSKGKPSVVDVRLVDEKQKDAFSLARAISARSLHPYSRSIHEHFKLEKEVSIENWKEHRGEGVSAVYNGKVVQLGSLDWLISSGVSLENVVTQAEGTLLGLSLDRVMIALFVLRDPPKDNARNILNHLRGERFKTFLFSGDMKSVVENFGTELGFKPERVVGQLKPDDKAKKILELQKTGEKIAFVGDGINDAPALAQADLGIAVTKASDVARESADIFLLNSDIEAIPMALELSKATLSTIKQNLFWAFFYNAAAIPLAASGLISPIVCAAAMGLSDLFVIGNALRLFRWKPR